MKRTSQYVVAWLQKHDPRGEYIVRDNMEDGIMLCKPKDGEPGVSTIIAELKLER